MTWTPLPRCPRSNCPPAALTKLPLTATPAMVCKLVALFEEALEGKEAEA